jgi:hypothetical protein
MTKLTKLISDLSTYIQDADKTRQSVSSVSVGWHIEHTLLVINKSIPFLSKSDPSLYQAAFN